MALDLFPGDVVWATLGSTAGREQSGHRPVVVVASPEYLDAVDALAIVVPITTKDHGWPNHVRVTGQSGLDQPSWAITEQPTTIWRERCTRLVGRVDDACLEGIRVYLRDFLDL